VVVCAAQHILKELSGTYLETRHRQRLMRCWLVFGETIEEILVAGVCVMDLQGDVGDSMLFGDDL
jgi:hypothetical protein